MARSTVKIAIVGSGLAGLTAAHLLTRSLNDENVDVEVHVFEKAATLGMDSSSFSLLVPGMDSEWRITVPMRSFQGGLYPQLIAMYKSLGIKFSPANFSYSFSTLASCTAKRDRKITTMVIHNGVSTYSRLSVPSFLIDRPRHSKLLHGFVVFGFIWTWTAFLKMACEIAFCFLLMTLYSIPAIRLTGSESMTFAEWSRSVAPNNFVARWIGLDVSWRNYVRRILLPIFSAVCTAPEEDIWNHPVEEILDYIWLSFGTNHYVVDNGVREVVDRLSKPIPHVHLSSSITSITQDPLSPHLASITCKTLSGEENVFTGFNHVVIATQANAAVSLLEDYAASVPKDAHKFKQALQDQASCLKAFHYRTTVVVNHTDDSLMPDDSRDRRELNLISLDQLAFATDDFEGRSSICVSPSHTMTTHRLSQPPEYPGSLPDVYQTTNPIIPPREDSILSVAKLDRAVLSPEGKKALQGLCILDRKRWWECSSVAKTRLGPLQGAGRLGDARNPGIWICGAFAYPGIPLLEGCVVSAKNIVVQGILHSEGLRLKEEPWSVSR